MKKFQEQLNASFTLPIGFHEKPFIKTIAKITFQKYDFTDVAGLTPLQPPFEGCS